MTKQEAYEQMREYFSRPGAELAKTSTGACNYVDSFNGNKCAVGCLIPDDLYSPNMEGNGVVDLLNEGNGVVDLLNEYSDENVTDELRYQELIDFFGQNELDNSLENFLYMAQNLHDTHADNAQQFLVLLDNLAKENNLFVV